MTCGIAGARQEVKVKSILIVPCERPLVVEHAPVAKPRRPRKTDVEKVVLAWTADFAEYRKIDLRRPRTRAACEHKARTRPADKRRPRRASLAEIACPGSSISHQAPARLAASQIPLDRVEKSRLPGDHHRAVADNHTELTGQIPDSCNQPAPRRRGAQVFAGSIPGCRETGFQILPWCIRWGTLVIDRGVASFHAAQAGRPETHGTGHRRARRCPRLEYASAARPPLGMKKS